MKKYIEEQAAEVLDIAAREGFSAQGLDKVRAIIQAVYDEGARPKIKTADDLTPELVDEIVEETAKLIDTMQDIKEDAKSPRGRPRKVILPTKD